jgi:hypothetical protein
MLWRVTRGGVVAGIVVEHGTIVEAAPILRWTTGKTWGRVKRQLVASGWHGDPLREASG